MKPFDLEEAKAGKPVCTRDGRKVRIICFDRMGNYPIIGLIRKDNIERIYYFKENGACVDDFCELMMAPEKKEGWVNVYTKAGDNRACCCIYPTKEEAMRQATMTNGEFVKSYITTTKIEWEE